MKLTPEFFFKYKISYTNLNITILLLHCQIFLLGNEDFIKTSKRYVTAQHTIIDDAKEVMENGRACRGHCKKLQCKFYES